MRSRRERISNGFSIVAFRLVVPLRACATETPAIRFSFPQHPLKKNRDERVKGTREKKKRSRATPALSMVIPKKDDAGQRCWSLSLCVPRVPSLTPLRQVDRVWIFCLLYGRNRLTRRSSPLARYCRETGFRQRMDRGQRGATLRNFRAETTSDGFTREMGTFEGVGNDGKVLFRLLSELPACVLGRSCCSETLGYLCFIAATNYERLARYYVWAMEGFYAMFLKLVFI